MEKQLCTAIVLAAGQGKRMGTKVQKQFLELQGRPILYYSLAAFEESRLIDEIILVTGAEQIEYCQKEIVEKYGFQKVTKIVAGGKERYHSVWNGLLAAGEGGASGQEGFVFIHDGARPFVDDEIIARAYGEVQKSKACVVGMPVKDTIKIADEDGNISSTPKRSLVWQIQTPQVFDRALITKAYRMVIGQEQELLRRGVQITDDAMVVEYSCKQSVRLVEGSYENIKITTPEDLPVAEIFCCKKFQKN